MRRHSNMTPTSIEATKRHSDMATYSATTLQSFIPNLVETLMVEQPADPVSFLRAHLDEMAGAGGAGAGTGAGTGAAPLDGASLRSTELRQLRAELAKLRTENEKLQSMVEASDLPSPSDASEAVLQACNWNLAGVNENPFEFAASNDDRFPRVAAFIAAVDTHLTQVLFTPDPDADEGEDAQVSAAVTEPFAAEVRSMPLSELFRGLLSVADEAKALAATSSAAGDENDEVDTVAILKSRKGSGMRRSFSVAEQKWADVDTNGDGIADAVAYDTTGDGVFDGLDVDGDGKVDIAIGDAAASGAGGDEEDYKQPLSALTLGSSEKKLAVGLAEMAGEIPRAMALFERGSASGYFSSPDLKLKDRTWTLTNSRPRTVKRFLAACSSCFAEAGQVEEEVDESVWWQHWLQAVCKSVPAETHDTLPGSAFPLAAFDVLLAKIAGRVISKMDADLGEVDAFLAEIKTYVGAMRTTSEAKAQALAKGFEWTIGSYAPSVIALQEFNAGWMTEPLFRRFWTDYVDGVHAEGGGFEVITSTVVKKKNQQTILLVKKGDQSGLTVDRDQTRLLANYVEEGGELKERLKAAFGSVFPEGIVDLQVENALKALQFKCANCVCTLCRQDGSAMVAESVLVVGAHAASDGTDNRCIVAAVRELALWLGTLPNAKATPRLMVMMDANSAAAFPKKGIVKGAATQQVFRAFLQNDRALSSCWLPRENAGQDRESVHHSVMKERTHLQTQWKKAGALDMSLKDWIVCSAEGSRAKGVAINRFGTPEFTKLEAPVWANGSDDTAAVWAEDAFMPGPQFPSDHAMVVAEIAFTERSPPASRNGSRPPSAQATRAGKCASNLPLLVTFRPILTDSCFQRQTWSRQR